MSRVQNPQNAAQRPFLGIYFQCCRIYARIYKHANGRCYSGRCPRCLATVTMPVGDGGSAQRQFIAR